MGRAGQSRRRRLRARHRPQRPRFRRARRSARVDAPRARARHARSRRERVAARSDGLRRADVPHDADCAHRARAASRKSRGSARRWARCSASWRRACRARRSRGWSSTMRDRCSTRRRSRASASTSARDPTFATYDDFKAYVTSDLRAVRPADRCAVGTRRREPMRAQRADGRWGVGYDPAIALPFRAQPRRAGPVAALGCDHLSDARAARRAIRPAVERHGARDERARAKAARRRIRRASAMRRCCCRATRSISSSSSFVRPYNRRRPKSPTTNPVNRRFLDAARAAPAAAVRTTGAAAGDPALARRCMAHRNADARTGVRRARHRRRARRHQSTSGSAIRARLDLAEQYWKSAAMLWPRLERQFTRASHPLQGDDLEAAKAALTLANELSIAYKRLLVREASRRFAWAARAASSRSSGARSRRRRASSRTATCRMRPCHRTPGTTRTTSTCTRASGRSTGIR